MAWPDLRDLVEGVEHAIHVAAGELPLGRSGDLLIAATVGEQRLLAYVEVGKVVGLEQLLARGSRQPRAESRYRT